jgi:hypothetical protein
MRYFTMLFLQLLFILTGCVKIINDDLKSEGSKLVVNSVISVDSVFMVNVSRTFDVFDDESADNLPFIDNATVKVFADGSYLTDLDHDEYGYYKAGFFPQRGVVYSLEVFADTFASVSCNAAIPEAVKIKRVDTLSTLIDAEYDLYRDYIAKLVYDDPPGEENYYMLSGIVDVTDGEGIEYYDNIWMDVPESESEFYDISNGYNLLWSDKLVNGNEVSIRFSYLQWFYYGAPGGNEIQAKITLYLKSITKDYYTYLRSVNLYQETYNSDPFMEPVVIHNNIKNGYGIFGAYDSDSSGFALHLSSGLKAEGGRQ